MPSFSVKGPFELALRQSEGNNARFLDDHSISAICREQSEFNRFGCYIFCSRVGPYRKPVYVGKAVRRKLRFEAFNPRNKNRIAEYINDNNVRALEIILVTQDLAINGRGSPLIDEVEEYLIGLAARRNKKLLNILKAGNKSWRIRGVVGSNAGFRGKAPNMLKRTLGLRSRPRRERRK
jgi:hypothetical protein